MSCAVHGSPSLRTNGASVEVAQPVMAEAAASAGGVAGRSTNSTAVISEVTSTPSSTAVLASSAVPPAERG